MSASPPSRRERITGWIILLALAGVAGALFNHHASVRQSTYGPAKEDQPEPSDTLRLASFTPPGFKTAGKAELFDATTLSDKIDGKAELYLSSGFQSLACQRFETTKGGGEPWLEWFVYDMATPRNAFAVFSLQRRPGAPASPAADLAYAGPNALFIAHGRWYMELIASVPDPAVVAAMESSVRGYIGAHPAGGARLEELALFPKAGQIPGSFTLHPSDVFGWEGLKDIFTMDFQAAESSITAFAGLRSTPDEASALAGGYANFLSFNGYTPWSPEGGWPPGFDGFQAFGMYEVVFHRGRVMGGMHDCSSAKDATAFARQWARELASASPTSSAKEPAP